MENVLTRLDSIVDRLEVVYSGLVPLIEERTGRSPIEITPPPEEPDDIQ